MRPSSFLVQVENSHVRPRCSSFTSLRVMGRQGNGGTQPEARSRDPEPRPRRHFLATLQMRFAGPHASPIRRRVWLGSRGRSSYWIEAIPPGKTLAGMLAAVRGPSTWPAEGAPETLDQRLHTMLDEHVAVRGVGSAVRPLEQAQRLVPRETGPQVGVAWHVGEVAVDLRRVAPGVQSENRCAA